VTDMSHWRSIYLG